MDTPPPGSRGSGLDCVCHPSSPVQWGLSMCTLQAGVLTGSHKHRPMEDTQLHCFPVPVVGLAVELAGSTQTRFSLLQRRLNHWPTQTGTFCPSMEAFTASAFKGQDRIFQQPGYFNSLLVTWASPGPPLTQLPCPYHWLMNTSPISK